MQPKKWTKKHFKVLQKENYNVLSGLHPSKLHYRLKLFTSSHNVLFLDFIHKKKSSLCFKNFLKLIKDYLFT